MRERERDTRTWMVSGAWFDYDDEREEKMREKQAKGERGERVVLVAGS